VGYSREPSDDELDAARYRWLRKQSKEILSGKIDVVKWVAGENNTLYGKALRMTTLDSVIDSEMMVAIKEQPFFTAP